MDVKMLKDIIVKQSTKGDYFILAANDRNKTKGWREVPIRYVGERKVEEQLREFERNFPETKYDLYFCPIVYKNNRRRKAEASDIKYLWSDIDEKEDITKLKYKPTYLWESSPNKWQGLWELDRYIDWKEAEIINKELNKLIGADNCYDVGHVLRIPGSINHKYKNKPRVGKVTNSKAIYRLPKLKKELIGKNNKKDKGSSKKGANALQIAEKYHLLEGRLGDLLTAKDTAGEDRSEVVWYLESTLYEKGLPLEDIVTVIKSTVWNKWSHMDDGGDGRLRKDIMKIMDKKNEKGGQLSRVNKKKDKLKITSFGDLMGAEEQAHGWLVEGWWGRQSQGIVAGQPKVYKSTYVQDLAVSVASGRPFLGKYKVLDPGPVILIQQENTADMIADRTKKIMCHHCTEDLGKAEYSGKRKIKITWGKEIPLHTINQAGLMLDDENDQSRIEEIIKEIRPVLVIFDPLYMMFNGSMNKAEELSPVLQWLTKLKTDYKTSVLLVHHYNKGSAGEERGGQKMLGSVVLHGWVASAWYIKRLPQDECPMPQADANAKKEAGLSDPTYVVIEREFREFQNGSSMKLGIQMADVGLTGYHVSAEEYEGQQQDIAKASAQEKKAAAMLAIKDFLRKQGIPQNKKEIMVGVWEFNNDLKISKSAMNEAIDALDKDPEVTFTRGKGWSIIKE